MGQAQRDYWRRRREARAKETDCSITCIEAAALARPRRQPGADNPNAALNQAQVDEFRGLLEEGLTTYGIARSGRYPVSESQLYRIKRGECWSREGKEHAGE